jgi:hypothetical protein
LGRAFVLGANAFTIPSIFLLPITKDQLQFTPDMKKMFVLSTLISFAMMCSCQKQDSTAEQQLAQCKAEVVALEKALDEKEKALAAKERTVARPRMTPADLQSRSQIPDPAQAQAERERRIQQLPPELRALISDRSRMDAGKAEKDAAMQDQAVQKQRSLEDAARKKATSGAIASPEAEFPEAEATSPPPPPMP